jgi:Short C-terminal domain
VSSNKQSREQKLLESGGTIAWATVLEAREKWQSETAGLSDVKITSHMHLKLRVEPEGDQAFEASFGQALTDTVPITGWICKVVFDPADRSRIAMIDGTATRPGVTPEQAAAEPHHSNLDQLTRLADLKDRGELTDAEFESAKAKLLSQS